MVSGKTKADLVVILRILPRIEALKSLEKKLLEELVKIDLTTAADLKTEPIEGGFEIINLVKKATVRILITTVMLNYRNINDNVHVNEMVLQKHMSAIRHVRWFEESANLTTIKVLVRVLKDICSRFSGLRALTPWMIDVLAHYAVTFRSSQQILALNDAFKRVLQLLAGGIFLPGSSGIPDPCGNGAITMHEPLTLLEQDSICMTAQTLIRVLAYSNEKIILGFEPDTHGICSNTTNFDDVVVVPCQSAYEDPRMQVDQPNNGKAPDANGVKVVTIQTELKDQV